MEGSDFEQHPSSQQLAQQPEIGAVSRKPMESSCETASIERSEALAAIADIECAVWLYSCEEKRNLWANRAAIAICGRTEHDFVSSSLFDPGSVDPASVIWQQFNELNQQILDEVEGQGQVLRCSLENTCKMLPGWVACPQSEIYPRALIYKPFRLKREGIEKTITLVQPAELQPQSHQNLSDETMLHLAAMSLNNPIHTFLFREDGSLIFENPAAKEYYKDMPNITMQQLFEFALRTEDSKSWEEMYEEAATAVFRDAKINRIQQQQHSRKIPEKIKWVELELRPMKDPSSGKIAALVSVQNISRAKEVEDALTKERNQLQAEKTILVKKLEARFDYLDKNAGFDQESPLCKTIEQLDQIIAGKSASPAKLEDLKSQLLKSRNLWQPNLLREQFLSKGVFESDVGLNLLELLGDAKDGDQSKDQAFYQSWEKTKADPFVFSKKMIEKGLLHENFIPYQIIPSVERVLMGIDEWTWDAFELDQLTEGCPCSTLGFWTLKHSGLIEYFELDEVKLSRFLRRIEEGYPANPYHNRIHACDVLQSIHVLIVRGRIFKKQTDMIWKLAAYIAAIIHDFEHGGLNNDYLVKSSDMLALRYNDKSPLENHHLAAAFHVLRHPECCFMSKMSPQRVSSFRHLCIDMVLATDMKQHFSILSQFQAKLCHYIEGSKYQDLDMSGMDETRWSLTLQIGLKCSDVGHLARSREVHKKWVILLEEEFFRQGDQERMNSMPISPLMDRNKPGITKSQVGFFDIVALPLFRTFTSVYTDCQPLLATVEDNFLMWKEVEVSEKAP